MQHVCGDSYPAEQKIKFSNAGGGEEHNKRARCCRYVAKLVATTQSCRSVIHVSFFNHKYYSLKIY